MKMFMFIRQYPLQSKFNKSYEAGEDLERRGLYEKAKARVEEHNRKFEKGEVTFKMAINHLADLNPEEYGLRNKK
ncbi:hypothetical protein KR018_011921 [Drosophila ironensis]|nr:hypothetical protein KR018_011921 [Drosophila ironensis]